LLGTGLVFLVIALGALVAPDVVAARYALALPTVDAKNEFRAVFVGFWIGLFVLFASAARHVRDTRLGDLAATLILAQALARLVSFVLDGVPSASFVSAAVGELVAALAILAIRL
jgi:hypothetical protein